MKRILGTALVAVIAVIVVKAALNMFSPGTGDKYI